MGKASGMKLCDTCAYGDKTEYFKPCIVYRHDCKLYEEKEVTMDDCISRQATLEPYKVLNDTDTLCVALIRANIMQQPSVNLQEPCGDTISRQAVLDLAEKGILVGNHNYKSVCNAINDLPSVTPTERIGHWIPVIERLPKDEDYVLVCYADGSIRTAYYYIDTESYPPEFKDCCETGWYDYNENFIYQDVLAWMPLPELYEPQESEEISEHNMKMWEDIYKVESEGEENNNE